MLTKKGYSLIMWTTTFAAVLAALVLVQVPFRRALETKLKATADYAIWSKWGDTPQRYAHDDNTRSRSKASQSNVSESLMSHDGTTKTYMATTEPSTEKGVYSGTSDGQEVRLKVFDLNQFNLD